MSKLKRLKDDGGNNTKIVQWLNYIGEHDIDSINEILVAAKADSKVMDYYLMRYESDSENINKPKEVTRHEGCGVEF